MEANEKEKAFNDYVAIVETVNDCKSPGQQYMIMSRIANFLESLWQAGYKKGYAKGVKEVKESLVKGHILN